MKTENFRPLNQRERNLIFSAVAATKNRGIRVDDLRHVHHNHLKVSYERMQGGFTVCVLVLGLASDNSLVIYLWRGVSRRSYKDKPNSVRGEMRAFSRAILRSSAVTL